MACARLGSKNDIHKVYLEVSFLRDNSELMNNISKSHTIPLPRRPSLKKELKRSQTGPKVMRTQNAKYRRVWRSRERTESPRILTAHSRETMSEGPESKHRNPSRDLRGVVVGTKATMVMKDEKSEIFDFASTIKNDKITS